MAAKLLLVSPPHRRSALLKQLEGKNLQLFLASDLREAQRKLSGSASFDLILADAELPDGSWQDLLQYLIRSERTSELIVCCGDERLWAEVLQCGAYDLIVEPYEQQEVARIIDNAIDSGYMRRFSGLAAARAS